MRLRAGLAFVALFCVAASSDAPPLLRAQGWTLQSDNLARALIDEPAECYAAPADETLRVRAEAGRALFRSPALLGGPAARVGLSCNACHVNGRDNPDFMLAELTDRAGAADVTSEWASNTRGDFTMNPRRIPDLLDARGRGVFGQGHVLSLEGFVDGVIRDEFQGPTLSRETFESVIAYLDTLQASACPAAPRAALTLGVAAGDVRRALDAATRADPATARLTLLAAQDAVGRIVERLPAGSFARERNRLAGLSRELGDLRGRMAALPDAAPGWRARFDAEMTRIAARERETYFDEATLRAALSN